MTLFRVILKVVHTAPEKHVVTCLVYDKKCGRSIEFDFAV
jgi:hypothetical protein